MDENERQAATIKVTISNYVATAALGVIAGAGVLYTYISQNFDPPDGFPVLMLAAVGALVLSIVLGGVGSDAAADKLAHKEWTKDTHLASFNWQAILTLVGLLLVLAATAVGAGSERQQSSTDKRLDALSQEVGALRARVRDQSTAIKEIRATVARLEAGDRRR